MYKICQCYNSWNKESDDCKVGFEAKHPNEQYCDPCKPIATKARVAYNVAKYRQRSQRVGVDYDITNPDWSASWIDRVCSCCGGKGVPNFNRYLCIVCWETYADVGHTLHVNTDGKITWAKYDESPSEVTRYSDHTYSQEQLQALIDECRTGAWKWTVPLSERLGKLLKSMGLQEGNCSAY